MFHFLAFLFTLAASIGQWRPPFTGGVAFPTGGVGGVLNHQPEIFVGGMLGVSATVELNRAHQRASIELCGVPFAGCIKGEAWFAPEGVEFDSRLGSALRKRMVSIESVEYVDARDEIDLTARLPIFGRKRLTLKRRGG
jgi:hypothetical protein